METPPPDQDQPAPHADALLEVTVLRSGGMAGMVRRWQAAIPDDGGLAAQAAHRIAGQAEQTEPAAQSVEASGTSPPPSRVRDGFLWTLRCGEGELRCDDERRRRDAHLNALVQAVTGQARSVATDGEG